MRYVELRQSLKDFTVFSLRDIKRIDTSFHRRRLNEWQDKGYIRKVIKGCYIFSDLELNENILFEISNRIYSPSYVSLETALSYYGIIPESVYGISAISTRRTYRFTTKLAEFSYRSITSRLFFGYEVIRYNKRSFKIASAEKAVLDYFYINTHIKSEADFLSLRMDKDSLLKTADKKKFNAFLKRFGQKRLKKRMQTFWKTITNA